MEKQQKVVKTTLIIPEDLWKKFTIKVIEKHGNRMNAAVIIKFIENYVKMNK